MSALISLFDLVNLSVGTPDVGAVNFNALHTLLHAIVGHLKIQDVTTEWNGDDGGRGSQDPPKENSLSREKPSPYHHMEGKLRQIERQMAALETLPNGTDLLTRTASGTTPVNDMWQLMQLRRKAQANEDGVSKSMALIQDLLKEIRELKEARNSLQEEVKTLQQHISQLRVNELQHRVTALEKCCHQVADLEKVLRELQERVGQYPEPEELTHFITWDVLQEALVSDRTSQQQEPEDLQAVSPLSSPRDATSLPPAQSGATQEKGAGHGAERYPETVDALRHLGRLRQRHETLEARVALLETDKADHAQLQHLRDLLNDMARREVPDDLLEQIRHLRTLVDGLMGDRDRTSAMVSDVQAAILQLQAECEKLSSTARHLVEEQSQRQQHIENLHKSIEQLEEKKADKDHVEMEIDIKADKQALESKVSRVQFDSMTEQLSSMFQDLLSKISGQEQDWHKVIQKISMEMECKLNRIELDPLKQQLEERWRAIRKQLQAPPAPELDDAAGIRKQLVARFHCISCDRPVDMMTPGPHLVTIPAAPGLPAHRSNRPYTVYELEQVRQHCRSDRIPEMTDYSYLAMSRNCGGSHTLTYPNRRYTRLQHIAQFIQEGDEGQNHALSGSSLRIQEEVDILGLDGHIYKGRLNSRAVRGVESRLPTISHKEGVCKGKDKVSRSQSQKSSAEPSRVMPLRPQSAKTHWSHSASGSSVRDRPMSSLGCVSQSSIPHGSTQVDPTGEAPQGLVLHVDLGQSGEDEPVTTL
ncbi:hypothetical protein MATL_G00212130 [Megalops atlanticus]|uniref:DUF4795 domain-containing protein n=1 Tax=Megalops atlanticus TaxID=7932 RepID=A0A9D3PIQ4_MEGAT|nr:hypothetical protein MATL_G00212130 [Megalops atlanticus]